MPITPYQAKEKARKGVATDYVYHCARIDKGLAEGDRTFNVHDLHPTCLLAVLEAYRHAGWNVSYVNDWRDGDFLKFEEP